MQSRAWNDGEYSEPFLVSNGVKQGCVLATALFCMISAMHTGAFQGCDSGSPIRYHFDDKFFKLRRFQAKSKMRTDVHFL